MSGYPYFGDMEDNSPAHRARPNSSCSSTGGLENEREIQAVPDEPNADLWSHVYSPKAHKPPIIQGEQVQRFAGVGIAVSSLLLEKLISHPCIVLRRQCQVNKKALRYHQTPFTLFSVTMNLMKRQSFGILWKGAGSVFIIHGLELATETAISDLFGFPREVFLYSPIKHLLQHLALKSLAHAFVTPFICTSLIETVQSDIASEKPGVLDCLKEGLLRVFQWGRPRTYRVVPIWLLVGPTVMHGVLHYSISSVSFSVSMWFLKTKSQISVTGKAKAKPMLSESQRFLFELFSTFFGSLIADVVLYPLETVIHRLYLQGTRSIIDNLDTGLSVIPVETRYEGIFDCFQTIIHEEGAAGLYRGFGAVIIQYGLQALLLKGTKAILDQVRQFANRGMSKTFN